MLIGIDANQANKPIKSGVEWYAYHLIQSLKKLSQTDEYRHLRFRLYSSAALAGDLAILPPNWESRVLPWISLPFWNFWTQIRLSLELCFHPVDRFVASGYTLPLYHPSRSLVVIHDLGFVHHPEYYPLIPRWYYRLVTWYSLQTAWRVSAPSFFTRDDIIKEYNYPAGKLLVIEPGYQPEVYRVISDKRLIQQTLAKHGLIRPYILYIGRLTANKNILGVVRAFDLLRQRPGQEEMKLALGGLPQHGWRQAREYIEKQGLSPHVKILGYVPEEDKPALMNAASVFLFPAFFEGFGMPVLEAMACGTPVVTSNVTSLPEVAQQAALLADPSNPADIAAKVEQVLSDKNLAKSLSDKGLERARLFSWEKTARATLDLLLRE